MNNTNVNWVEFRGQIYREDHKLAPFTSIEGKHYPDYHDGLVSVVYAEGDRALIAAAPELLKTLECLLNELDGIAFHDIGTARAELIYEHAGTARAVISKAKGEPKP